MLAWLLGVACWFGCQTPADAVSPEDLAAERGRKALLERSFLPAAWSREAYEKASTFLGEDAPSSTDAAAYEQAFRDRYGLHPAPFPNHGLPMGLREARSRRGEIGLHIDCMVCHGGSIGGTSYVGLGNTQLDLEALLKDLTRAEGGIVPISLFTINSTRGTNNAGMIDVALLSLREPDLSYRRVPLLTGANLPELDTPAWWLLKKKRTKYYDGRTSADAVRSNMQFLMGSLSRTQIEALEPTFEDLDQYFRSIEPPKYPFPIDARLAETGRAIFEDQCARCHGTYGANPTYPNKIIPLAEIGTDPARARGLSRAFVAHYNASWFGEKHPVNETLTGYQAPPLDGVWATAPYLHNGTVPTIYHMLKSSERPAQFLRPPTTGFEHYDTQRVGWKSSSFELRDTARFPGERKRVVDTSRFGLGNGGHTYGDVLSEEERNAVIEYLKTL